MNETLYIIDGFSLVFRSYYAFIRAPLTYKGMNTGALYGFFQTIATLRQNENIEYIALVFDPPGKSFRNDIFTDYKAHRPSPPEDLQEQIPIILSIIKEAGLPYFAIDSYEADDVIASIARQARDKNISCKIVSSDKDLLQLLDPTISMLKPSGKGLFELLNPENVKEQWGLHPGQIGDLLAIMGDSADNVPGIAGIGKIGATKLLQEYESLENIYKNIDALKPSMQKKLDGGRENADLSRTLVTLHNALEVISSKEALRITTDSLAKIHASLKEYGISSIFRDLGDTPQETESRGVMRSDAYKTVRTQEELTAWIDQCKRCGLFALQCFRTAHDPMQADLIGLAISYKTGEGCYIPIESEQNDGLSADVVMDILRPLIADPRYQYVGHDIKNDIKLLSQYAISSWQSVRFDTMIAAWLLDSSEGQYELAHIALRYLAYTLIEENQVIQEAGITTKHFDLAQLPLELVTQYCAERADLCLRLHTHFLTLLTKEKLYPLFTDLEMKLLPVLAEMEIQGMYVKKEELHHQGALLQEEITSLQERIRSEVGYDFNMNSTQQLQKILFEERGLHPIKKTKTGFSTDSDVLEILAKQDPLPQLILRYRLLTKLKSTYLDALAELINPKTQCIHTTFQQTVAATGRLSSKDPNLQNIPIKDEEGRRIRNAFIPHPGNVLVGADYAQIELVVLAHLSNDNMLQQAFREEKDVHTQTASLIFGRAPDQIGQDERRVAKTINFGVIYGMSAFRLANELGIPRKTAQGFINNYFETYSGVAAYSRHIIEQAEKDGYVSTIMGRKRPLHHIISKNFNLRSADHRIAVNTVIQGSAADIIKKAMIDLHRVITAEQLPCVIVLQVHDELLIESPEHCAQDVLQVLTRTMEDAVQLSIPLSVSAEIGSRWGALH